MSDQVSNKDLYDVLLDIKQDLGRVEGKVDGHGEWMLTHSAEDKALAATVSSIQLNQAQQRGSTRTWSTLGAVAGSIIGAAAAYLGGKH